MATYTALDVPGFFLPVLIKFWMFSLNSMCAVFHIFPWLTPSIWATNASLRRWTHKKHCAWSPRRAKLDQRNPAPVDDLSTFEPSVYRGVTILFVDFASMSPIVDRALTIGGARSSHGRSRLLGLPCPQPRLLWLKDIPQRADQHRKIQRNAYGVHQMLWMLVKYQVETIRYHHEVLLGNDLNQGKWMNQSDHGGNKSTILKSEPSTVKPSVDGLLTCFEHRRVMRRPKHGCLFWDFHHELTSAKIYWTHGETLVCIIFWGVSACLLIRIKIGGKTDRFCGCIATPMLRKGPM